MTATANCPTVRTFRTTAWLDFGTNPLPRIAIKGGNPDMYRAGYDAANTVVANHIDNAMHTKSGRKACVICNCSPSRLLNTGSNKAASTKPTRKDIKVKTLCVKQAPARKAND